MLEAIDIIKKCDELGIFLRPNGDKIRYKGPSNAVQIMIPLLIKHKSDVLQLLKQRSYVSFVVSNSGIFAMPDSSVDANWTAIYILASELKRYGLSSQDSLERAYCEITNPEVHS